MLSITEIEKEFPPHLQPFKRNMLREYLQYKILELLFSHPLGQKFRFIGGTALRIVHGLPRFSENLDFDHTGITLDEFKLLSEQVKKGLENEGYDVEISFSGKPAFRCNIRIPKLLFPQGLSPLQKEKILIQLDTENQAFEFVPEKVFINKFDVFRPILVTPIDILLSQKLLAAFNRNRPKGRDFYDIIFLLGKTRPNYRFLSQKKGINNSAELLAYIQEKGREIKFKQLVEDLRPFVFDPTDANRILSFLDYIASSRTNLDSIDDYLGQQGFEYDSDEMMYFHPTKKTIMSKEWVDRNPRKAEEEAMAINQVPKLYVNKLTNHKMKELVKTYYPSY